MNYITLNKDGFAEVSGWINCHVADLSGEYIGQRDEYISATTGLPAGAYLDAPPEKKEGFTIVRGKSGWELTEDNRGKDVYFCENGSKSLVDYIGAIREGYTYSVPATSFDKWDGAQWVTDTSAQKAAAIAAADAEKSRLYAVATEEIEPLQDAVDLEIATDEEIALLKEWKKYRVLLNRVDTSKPDLIVWPEAPGSAVVPSATPEP